MFLFSSSTYLPHDRLEQWTFTFAPDTPRFTREAQVSIDWTLGPIVGTLSNGDSVVTRLTLSCMECGSNVDITELRASDTDTGSILQVRCPACHEERMVEVRHDGVELAVEATVSSHTPNTTNKGGLSSSMTSAKVDDEGDSISDTDEDSVVATSEADHASRIPAAAPSTNQSTESQPERDTVTEDESVSDETASEPEEESEADESVATGDYETVLSELNAVRGAGVKNLRDRSEVKRVANAVGHEALLEFLQDADDTEYRTVIQDATESRD